MKNKNVSPIIYTLKQIFFHAYNTLKIKAFKQ